MRMMTPHYGEAFADISHGLSLTDMWGRMGWADVKRRYRRTVIGPFWQSLTLLIFVLVMSLVWATLFNMNVKEYLPYLCSSMIVWLLLSAFITEGATLFVSAEGLIKQLKISYMMLVCAMIWRTLIASAHNLLVYVPVYLFAGLPVNGYVLLAIPGLIILCVNGAWIALVLGMLVARYRDVEQIVGSFLQIAMFITPIFWSPSQLSGPKALLVHLNILYHYVAIVRDPLLGKPPAAESWFIVGLATICGWSLAFYLFARFRRRIAYWL
jgi:ABC-type polysaccharide/polyol phosphate export permease